MSIGGELGFRGFFGLIERGDEFDDLRREEALTLSAILQGFISFSLSGASPSDCKKSSIHNCPGDQLIKYFLRRVRVSYEDLLTLAEPCSRPDLQSTVDLDKIEIPNNLIRSDPEAVRRLATEIAAHGGLINPITVVWVSKGKFRLVAGRRRYEACKLLGWRTIPVRIIAGDETFLISTQIIENDARLDMDPFTRAEAYMRMKKAVEEKKGSCSNKELATALGVTPQKVSEVFKLLELPKELRAEVHEMSYGHRATVDFVREITKSENSEQVLKVIKEQKTASNTDEDENLDAVPSTKKTRRKAYHFQQDGFDVTIKSPKGEVPSKEILVEHLESIINKLKTEQES